MGRQHVLCAEDLLDGGLDAVESFGAGVGIVGNAHGGHLLVTHSVHTGIGDHVQVNISVLEQESVVSGFLDFLQTFFDGEEGELLDHADLVHLQGNLILRLVKFYGHIIQCYVLMC